MKITRLASPLHDAPFQSSPRLRHGRRLALLFYPNQTQKRYTLFFALSVALLPHLLISQTVFPGNQLRSMLLTSDPTFPFLSQRPCVAEPEVIFLSFTVPPPRGVSFVLLLSFFPTEFLVAATNLSSSTAIGPDKVAYPMLKHLPCSGMDFLLHIFNLSWTLHSFPSIWKTSSILFFLESNSILSLH